MASLNFNHQIEPVAPSGPFGNLKRQARKAGTLIVSRVAKNPLPSVAIGASAGFLIGWVAYSLTRKRHNPLPSHWSTRGYP